VKKRKGEGNKAKRDVKDVNAIRGMNLRDKLDGA
jgi:hypothetical protein